MYLILEEQFLYYIFFFVFLKNEKKQDKDKTHLFFPRVELPVAPTRTRQRPDVRYAPSRTALFQCRIT